MTKHIVLCILFVCGSIAVQAQGTMDKLKFEEAEAAYLKKNYVYALNLLEELEAKGLKNPKILHLKILATSRLVIGYPYEFIDGGFNTIEKLRKDCNFYLSQYDIEGFEEKYKEVYDISKKIAAFPNTLQEWDSAINKINNRKKQVIENFLNSAVKVEKGVLYRYARYRGTRGDWGDPNDLRTKTDFKIIEEYKDYGNKTKEIEIDYNFYIIPLIIKSPRAEIVGAVLGKDSNYNKMRNLTYFTFIDACLFIKALNEKTGKKFRFISQAELEYIRHGGNKYVEKLVEKKIIGGNKRKGFEYEYKYYYTYSLIEYDPGGDKSTDFGFVKDDIPRYIFVQGVLDRNNYASFSGKASTIPNQNMGLGSIGHGLTPMDLGVAPDYLDLEHGLRTTGYIILVLDEK